MKLQGIFPAITTPFDHNGDLYKVKVQHNIEKWNRTGLAGYLVTGSTGETPYLTAEEKIQVWEWSAQHAASDKILIAGSGAESVRESVRLTNRAAELGYKAGLVLAPHYFRSMMSRMETQILFFRTVADQAKIPILLYHFPQVTGIDLTPDAVATLADHPNIIGMKDSSGNLEGTKRFIAAVKPGFQVLTGVGQACWRNRWPPDARERSWRSPTPSRTPASVSTRLTAPANPRPPWTGRIGSPARPSCARPPTGFPG